MKHVNKIASLLLLFSVFLVVGCGSGSGHPPAAPSPPPPQPPPTSQAVLKATLDAPSCQGVASNVDVFVDGALIGTINPGDAGVSRTVSVGDHTLGAAARTGSQRWDTRVVTVTPAGYHSTLTCSQTEPPPTSTHTQLRVQLSGDCIGRVSEADVVVDGQRVGVVQVQLPLTTTVSVGSHVVSAASANGWSWSPMNISVGSELFTLTLKCT